MRILLISYFVAPLQKIGSIRWTKISKYLKQYYNIQIDVLTMEKDFDKDNSIYAIEKKDPLLMDDVKVFDSYKTLRYGVYASIYRYFYYSLRNMAKTGEASSGTTNTIKRNDAEVSNKGQNKERLKVWLLNKKEQIEGRDSVKQCLKHIKKSSFDYDVIVSTYSPIWTHLVAEKIKSKHPDVLWLADFRDAYAVDILPADEYNKRKSFGGTHLKSADAVIKVTEEMNLFLPENSVCEYVIPNGYDPGEAVEPIKPMKFNFVYTGSLYGEKRDLTPLFEALRELSDESRIDLSDVVIDYAGVHGSNLFSMAFSSGIQDYVVDHGRVRRDEALSLQASSAILLLADWNTKLNRPKWSGKAYEYMMAKKPIVFIMSGDMPNSIPSKDIGNVGGFCYEKSRHKETMVGLKNYIEEQYKTWKNTGDILISRNEEYINRFSYERIAAEIWELLQTLRSK